MDSRWFAEDRKLPKKDQAESIKESRTALKNSTLLSRRLSHILTQEVEKTYTKEEDYEGTDWAMHMYGLFARRKTLKEIIKLLP